MNELQELLQIAQRALSEGADSAQVNRIIARETNGTYTDVVSLREAAQRDETAEEAPSDAPERSSGLLSDLARSFAQGATFGFGDELAGLASGAEFTGDSMREATAASRERLAGIRERRPVSSALAELLGMVAAPVAASALGVGGMIGGGVAAGGAALRGARTGAILGGLFGAGSAEGGLEERAVGAAGGAAGGGLFGGAVGGASRLAPRMLPGRPDRVAKSVKELTGHIQPEAMTPAQERAATLGRDMYGRSAERVKMALKEVPGMQRSFRWGMLDEILTRLESGDPASVTALRRFVESPSQQRMLRDLFPGEETWREFTRMLRTEQHAQTIATALKRMAVAGAGVGAIGSLIR